MTPDKLDRFCMAVLPRLMAAGRQSGWNPLLHGLAGGIKDYLRGEGYGDFVDAAEVGVRRAEFEAVTARPMEVLKP